MRADSPRTRSRTAYARFAIAVVFVYYWRTGDNLFVGAGQRVPKQAPPHQTWGFGGECRGVRPPPLFQPGRLRLTAVSGTQSADDDADCSAQPDAASKSEMLRFALPALGIFLADPIMVTIDNAFVGRFSGTAALAALGPGNVVASNVIFLFSSILCSATTGLVSRAWADPTRKAAGAREELRRTMSFSLLVGIALTITYLLATPWALTKLGTPEQVLPIAAEYARIRGLVAWATLTQSVSLTAILATRDSITPFRVVAVATLLNFLGDCLLCYWPVKGGVAGAAGATAISTLAGFALMLRALNRKGILPRPKLPSLKDAGPVLEYAGPLFVIVTSRVLGFSGMAVAAAALGTTPLAAYQVIIGIFVVFAFVGGPLSQNAQTLLPPLVDAGDTTRVRRALWNLLVIAGSVASVVACVLFISLRFAGPLFTADQAVISQVAACAFVMALSAGLLLVSSSVDGALLAAKDFRFVVPAQLTACMVQMFVVAAAMRMNLGLPFIFLSFPIRLVLFMTAAAVRLAFGMGPLGRVLKGRPSQQAA